jgi:hypothetical protein
VVTTIGQVLAALEEHLFVGRQAELERFRQWLLDRLPMPTTALGDSGGADRLRHALHQAIGQASEDGTPADALAYRAIELAYVERSTSHEAAARQLAVSRSTFYRLLKRGIHSLARTLTML